MIFGRISGVNVVYIESMARITSPSLTGRLAYPFADTFHRSMARPAALLQAGPLLTEPSLILLSLGTHQQPCPRALDLVEPLARNGENLIDPAREHSPQARDAKHRLVEFMPYEEVVDAMAKADSVICHAGVGTIMTALKAGTHRWSFLG